MTRLALICFILFHILPANAQNYDLLIRNGRVIDPSQGMDGSFDIAFKNGLVVAVESSIDPETSAEVYDATGKIVVPGLVDLHAHCKSSGWPLSTLGIDCDLTAKTNGYTTMVSTGDIGWNSAGQTNAPAVFAASMAGKTTRILGFLNVGWRGMINGWEYPALPLTLAAVAVCPGGIITRADIEVCETAGVLATNPTFWAGIKVRASTFLVGTATVQVLQMALDAAAKAETYTGRHFPIMVHVGALESTSMIDTIVAMLRAGDIITHAYSEWTHSVPGGVPTGFAQNGSCANHSAAAAVAKGIIIDLGASSGPTYTNNAFGPLSLIACGKLGITAHSLSADDFNAGAAIYSMTDLASILLGLNTGNNISPTPPPAFLGPISPTLTLSDLVTKMTRGPALALGDRVPALLGTLQVDAPADAAIWTVTNGTYTYVLSPWTVTSSVQITTVKTIKAGIIQ